MLLPAVIFVGAVSTLAATIARGGVRRDEPIPFGPGLCAAGFLAVMAAPRLSGL
jgi:prepilin signal peptidase PulO-like enzyme (type II secretory pathway)